MRQNSFNFNEGEVLLLNKPLTWTSFDVVNKVRNETRAKKVGHAGTLDPLATGLLILCTGKSTKKIDEYQAKEKEYTGTITLGSTTPSYDLETEIDTIFDISHITPEAIKTATVQFIGTIMQMPPQYSAKNVNGERAYNIARRGEIATVIPRQIEISEFEIVTIDLPKVEFRVVCGKGTYIRSLAHDFGKALNSGAHLSSLCRTRIGSFKLEDAWQMEDFIAEMKVLRSLQNEMGISKATQ